MLIQFATCERDRALGFLKKFYPSREIKDEGTTKAVLDLVEADVFRIPDPDFHAGAIFPSKNWDESKRADYIAALTAFHEGK